jgi:hypothetical protein
MLNRDFYENIWEEFDNLILRDRGLIGILD